MKPTMANAATTSPSTPGTDSARIVACKTIERFDVRSARLVPNQSRLRLLPRPRPGQPSCFWRMMFSAPPARNHSVWSWLKV